jgi:carbonic anhydrase
MIQTSEPVVATPDQALEFLKQGNQRYCTGRTTHPNQSAGRRAELAKGQKPWALVWGCIDSRVPPELVFDCGLGDLFVIRTAGQVMDSAALASLELAVEEGIKLVMVLGHQDCRTVKAAIQAADKSQYRQGQINFLLKAIKPAVEKTKEQVGDWVDNAVRANIAMQLEQLQASSETLRRAISAGKTKMVGARYSIVTGQVEMIARVPPA